RNLWIITSSEALRILYDWIRMVYSNEFVAKLQCLHLFVPHARIEETAKTLGFPFVTLTASGDENLLVALQSYV
ncbi:MAG: uroporphyrinogen III synthase, partial [Burkholderiales bacterium]|nr:uroporphyrinogen III synthase [Burkholderiales bacterium]